MVKLLCINNTPVSVQTLWLVKQCRLLHVFPSKATSLTPLEEVMGATIIGECLAVPSKAHVLVPLTQNFSQEKEMGIF